MIAELEKNIQEIIHAEMRAYLVRGVDLKWRAKRGVDGETICKKDGRIDAITEANAQGYYFMY